jgi:hypothetical protein
MGGSTSTRTTPSSGDRRIHRSDQQGYATELVTTERQEAAVDGGIA